MTFELGGQTIQAGLHLEIVLLVVGVAVVYETLVRRYGLMLHPRPSDPPITARHRAMFYTGLLTFWFASGSPLHDISESYLFSAHMIQHLLQALVVPPLLLLGIPTWMGELLLKNRRVLAVVRFVCRPVVAAIGFNFWLVMTHWPPVIDAMLTNDAVHFGDHFFLVAVALAMWANIFSPVPRLVPRLNPLAQLFYLFLMTLLPTIPSAFLIFGETPLYARYATFPRLWDMSALTDMQVSGLIMKLGGGFYLWTVITVLFFRWAGREERRDKSKPTREPADLPAPV